MKMNYFQNLLKRRKWKLGQRKENHEKAEWVISRRNINFSLSFRNIVIDFRNPNSQFIVKRPDQDQLGLS